jgi:hypothetical protein
MSAFKVSDNHIRIIAYTACSDKYFSYVWRGKVRKLGLYDLNRVCTLLAKENDRSLLARYPRDYKELGASKRAVQVVFAGPDGIVEAEPRNDTYGNMAGLYFLAATGTARTYKLAEVYQAVQCYEYQACEHEGWRTSEAAAICLALADRLASALIRSAGLLEKVDWTY